MTINKKGICIGVSEFSKVISSSGYYVDKTHLIEGILDSLNQVILFTRPRRFGKTLNMTMLRDFCDISKDTRELFSGLYIEDSIIIKEINSFPVLYFTFKDCKGNKPMMISKIRRVLREAFLEYKNAIVENEACDSLKDEFMSIYGELSNLDSDDLVVAMDKTFQLGMDTDNMKGYLKSERPIALIRGKRTLEEFGVRNGTVIYFTD